MSNELTTNPAAYLELLKRGSSEEVNEEFDSDINPNKLVHRIVITKDSSNLIIKLDKQQTDSPKFLYLNFLVVRGSRALFPPQNHPNKEQYKAPICRTDLLPPKSFNPDTARGIFRINKDFMTPYAFRNHDGSLREFRLGEDVEIECSRCPYNRFESEGSWDTSKGESKGKACKEGRLFLVRVMEKVHAPPMVTAQREEMYFFKNDEQYNNPVQFRLTLGANKAEITQFLLSAKARNMPLTSLVYKIGVKIEEKAGVKWAVFTWELAGIVDEASFNSQKDDIAWAREFIERNKVALVAGPTDEEIDAAFGT